jgi:hypothetical protein
MIEYVLLDVFEPPVSSMTTLAITSTPPITTVTMTTTTGTKTTGSTSKNPSEGH